MKNKYLMILSILFASVFTMNFRCEKELVLPYEQNFEATVNIYPLKKVYTLSDTIWLETNLPTKFLFDKISKQNVIADTGAITFDGNFNIFGTSIRNPSNGFCDVISLNGINVDRTLYDWGTKVYIRGFGCGRSDYKLKVGFKPNIKGTYHINLNERPLESCPNKVIPYYATLSYKFPNVDLGLDIFNSLSQNDKGGNNGKFYMDKIKEREIFVFKVE